MIIIRYSPSASLQARVERTFIRDVVTEKGAYAIEKAWSAPDPRAPAKRRSQGGVTPLSSVKLGDTAV
jgi:hypothetical protein